MDPVFSNINSGAAFVSVYCSIISYHFEQRGQLVSLNSISQLEDEWSYYTLCFGRNYFLLLCSERLAIKIAAGSIMAYPAKCCPVSPNSQSLIFIVSKGTLTIMGLKQKFFKTATDLATMSYLPTARH